MSRNSSPGRSSPDYDGNSSGRENTPPPCRRALRGTQRKPDEGADIPSPKRSRPDKTEDDLYAEEAVWLDAVGGLLKAVDAETLEAIRGSLTANDVGAKDLLEILPDGFAALLGEGGRALRSVESLLGCWPDSWTLEDTKDVRKSLRVAQAPLGYVISAGNGPHGRGSSPNPDTAIP